MVLKKVSHIRFSVVYIYGNKYIPICKSSAPSTSHKSDVLLLSKVRDLENFGSGSYSEALIGLDRSHVVERGSAPNLLLIQRLRIESGSVVDWEQIGSRSLCTFGSGSPLGSRSPICSGSCNEPLDGSCNEPHDGSSNEPLDGSCMWAPWRIL